MKHIWFVLSLLAILTFTACSDNGKPDLDDPKAVAEYSCERIKEILVLMQDAEGNYLKIQAIGQELDRFDEEFNKHHGDNAQTMQKKVDEQLEVICADLPNAK